MHILNKPLRSYFLHRKKRVEQSRKYPIENQLQWLVYLQNHGVNTSFGKEFGIQKNASYEDFSTSIPLQDYNSLTPYIERIIAGEENVLWDTRVQWLSKSSGTTESKSKFIPVSRESLRYNNYLCAQDTLTCYCMLFPNNRLFSGKGLMLGGAFQEMPTGSKVQIGDVSAILLDNMPRLGDILKASTREVLLSNDWNKKLSAIANTSYNQNVTSISGVPSWMLLVLKEVLNISGKSHIKEVWSDLELFMHGGVSFAPYIHEYKKLIPDDSVFYMNMYNASEGFFGFQDQKECDDLLLLNDCAVFYEFIFMDEVGTLTGNPMPLSEVKTGQNYAVVITTAAGLWRYVIGDTVIFTSTAPYRFKITGRTMHFINAFGEELIVDNADKALYKACHETNAVISDYTAAPVFLGDKQEKACHEWMIEFTKEPSTIELFINVLDKTLQTLNSDYETKRTGNLILQKPVIHSAPQGTFLRWLNHRNHLGGQHKVPRLQNDRRIMEELLLLLNNLETEKRIRPV